MIKVNMVDAIKVKFLDQIFEEDFPERGMVAWLTDIEWIDQDCCYKLFFDFTDFEQQNDKYLKENYYPNIYTKELERKSGRTLFTAKEAGLYSNKYSVLFNTSNFDDRDDGLFEQEIQKFLVVI